MKTKRVPGLPAAWTKEIKSNDHCYNSASYPFVTTAGDVVRLISSSHLIFFDIRVKTSALFCSEVRLLASVSLRKRREVASKSDLLLTIFFNKQESKARDNFMTIP